MARRRPGKENGAVGVDIGSYSVKVSVVGGSAEGPVLEAYNVKNITPSGSKPDLGKEVKEALNEIDVLPESVNLSVFGPDVIVRFINLPKMTKEQLDAALIFEAEKYIPFNVREVVLDSVVINDSQEDGQMKVLLAAAKRTPIEAIVRVFGDMGMHVNFIDITAFAGFNAFMATEGSSLKNGIALLDIGHSQTSLLISVDGSPFFVRQIHIGGRDIDAMLARTLSVTAEKASEYKRGIGDFDKETVAGCVKKVLDGMIREIQLSFGYFAGTCNSSIDGIYCSGGMIYSPGVIEYITEKMGMKVEKWDPVRGMKVSESVSRVDLDSVSSCLPVSIGLAIRG
jgi:type IV pilus assembly protein PilM